jgi:hypothetical protein
MALASQIAKSGTPTEALTALGTTHGFCRVVQHEVEARRWVEALLTEFTKLSAGPALAEEEGGRTDGTKSTAGPKTKARPKRICRS